MEFGKPAFVQVTDAEMGFEKIVKIAHSRGGKAHLCSVKLDTYTCFSITELDWNLRCSVQATEGGV